MKRIGLLLIVVVAVGWVYRGQLPFLSHRVGSAAGAEQWLTQASDPAVTGGTVLNGTVVANASCHDASQPNGGVENHAAAKAFGVRLSWYDCTLHPLDGLERSWCVAALTGGALQDRLHYALAAIGSCRGANRGHPRRLVALKHSAESQPDRVPRLEGDRPDTWRWD